MFNVGILGATGMVGQRFLSLLENHPWFNVVTVAASPRSAGKTYEEALEGRWKMKTSIPQSVKNLIVLEVEKDMNIIAQHVDLVFCALDLEKNEIKKIEEAYASLGIPVVSNNSAHRWTEDVPMIMPEINHQHTNLIDLQRRNRGWKKGCIVVKPNCSLQSYLPPLYALKEFEPEAVSVTTLQAVSGAGKTLETWPDIVDNVIPFIEGEEEKSEREPKKIWRNGCPKISTTCIRVPVCDGHLASVSVRFWKKPSREEVLEAWKKFNSPLIQYALPSSPPEFLHYCEEENRPQTQLDRDFGHGMSITVGRLRQDADYDWKFVSLSHNTIRGAAGGAILTAELLVKKGYVK